MADNITGSCELDPSEILVPDDEDNILPPGWVDSGVIPGLPEEGDTMTGYEVTNTAETPVEVDLITGCDGSEVIIPPEPECPDGYEMQCVEITDYPLLPPGQYDCTVVANDTGSRGAFTTEAGNCVMIGNGYIRFYDKDMNPGAYIGSKYRDAAHDQGFVWLCNTATASPTGCGMMYKYEDGTGNFVLSRNLLTEYGIENVSSTQLTASDGYICTGGSMRVSDVFTTGALLLNYNMEYIKILTGADYFHSYAMNGHLITSNSDRGNIAVRDYDGNFIKWLPLPTERSGNFFYHMVNLFTVEGVTRMAVIDGDLKDALGIDAVTPYSSAVWRVTLYDENFDIVKTIQSPQTGGVVKTSFGGSISRYGKYIMIGEGYASIEGITRGGAASLFDLDGNYVKSIIMSSAATAPSIGQFGTGVFLTEDQTVMFGCFNGDQMRICQNNPPEI